MQATAAPDHALRAAARAAGEDTARRAGGAFASPAASSA